MLQVFDSWGGELSPTTFTDFSLPYLGQIPTRVRAALEGEGLKPVPMIVFAKGAHFALPELGVTGYDVIGLDWSMKPADARKLLQGAGKALQGNLDPCVLYGDPATIREEARKMFEAFFATGCTGYIANLGHGIYPGKLTALTLHCQLLTVTHRC